VTARPPDLDIRVQQNYRTMDDNFSLGHTTSPSTGSEELQLTDDQIFERCLRRFIDQGDEDNFFVPISAPVEDTFLGEGEKSTTHPYSDMIHSRLLHGTSDGTLANIDPSLLCIPPLSPSSARSLVPLQHEQEPLQRTLRTHSVSVGDGGTLTSDLSGSIRNSYKSGKLSAMSI
jgi:hypothetical protein